MVHVQDFSKTCLVRILHEEDVDCIYELCKTNPQYYVYCPPQVSKKSIAHDLQIFPKNSCMENKYYVGYFKNEELIAILDFIDAYPKKNTCFIGFFMVHAKYQHCGMGSKIMKDLLNYLDNRYAEIHLGWMKENKKAKKFLEKHGFVVQKEENVVYAIRKGKV